MKKLKMIFICGSIFLSYPATATNIGLGVSVKSNDGSVYLPISFNSNFFVEPYVGYREQFYSSSAQNGYADSYESKYTDKIIGVGLFKLQPISRNFNAYFGVRTGYTKSTRKTVYDYIGSNHISEESVSGYLISPTLGLEYHIANNFNVCLEAEYSHYKYDGEGSTESILPENYTIKHDVEMSGQSTNTRLLVRYFF